MVAGAAVTLLAMALGSLLTRPLPPPKVSDYVQIANDGVSKVFPLPALSPFLLGSAAHALLVTDGSRLYFKRAAPPFALAQVSAEGGETVSVAAPFSPVLGDISPNHTELLVFATSEGGPLESPIWAFPVPGGVITPTGRRAGPR